jgi:hypothetical protein
MTASTLPSHSTVDSGYTSAILSRVVSSEVPEMSEGVARAVLDLRFPADDERRMSDLSEKARQGTLSSEEEREIDAYLLVGDFVSLLKSKARLSLKKLSG